MNVKKFIANPQYKYVDYLENLLLVDMNLSDCRYWSESYIDLNTYGLNQG